MPDGGTRLTHRERFTGALTVFGGAMFDRTRAGFEAFNTAFKARCEQPSMVDGR
ncbi:hypothetical protein ABZ863_19125 [Saccharomonospora sp. NPDC046836]|uniref:hypothetical protein n=1 Tax=Saccharomonospora sp. NPDC046836 TaxID=3156921 RepID=UPI0033F23A69